MISGEMLNEKEYSAGYEQGKAYAEGIMSEINAEVETIKSRLTEDYLEGFLNALTDYLGEVPCGAHEVQ